MAARTKYRSQRPHRGAERIGQSSPGRHVTGARRGRRDPESYLGIPGAEITPNVRSAVMRLMDELDQLKHDLSQAEDRVSELQDIADEDPLVPVLNRRGFIRELDRAIAYVNRYKTGACMVYIDLDGFKEINDIYGHAAGDAALKFTGAFLVANVRSSDIVGRLGGDEFAIVLHQADRSAAKAKARHLEEGISEEPFAYQDCQIDLCFSAGVAEISSTDSSAEIVERADKAMFARKKSRRRSGVQSQD